MTTTVSAQKLSWHDQIEWENVQFLTSPDGGSLTMENVAKRLGVGLSGLEKRVIRYRKVTGG